MTVESKSKAAAKVAAPSPARPRPTTKTTTVSVGSPVRITRKGSTPTTNVTLSRGGTPVKTKPKPGEKKVFSPVRDPLGNSHSSAGDISGMFPPFFIFFLRELKWYWDSVVQMETLGSLRKKTPRNGNENGGGYLYEKARRPSSRLSATTTTRTTTSRASSSSALGVPSRASSSSALGVPDDGVRSRSRAGSVASGRSGAGSRAGIRVSISRGESPELPTPYSISALSTRDPKPKPRSRTPSPELVEPATPVPAKKKMGLGVLGLGTPEVERWIEAGKVKEREEGRKVGFGDVDEHEHGSDDDEDEEAKRNLSMQLSPRRAPPSWTQAPIPSPLRPSPSSSAHELLRTIMADVMYDYQRETKAEMMGLHLDLVRMGRGIRREMREGGEAGELQRLREENRVLREENERLRRGY